MTVLVLDSEAFSLLARRHGAGRSRVRAAMTAAHRLGRDVDVPAVTLAELYRGPGHDQQVDACLSRATGLTVRDTDRRFARLVGSVLTTARSGSVDMVDAHAVAVAVDAGGGVVLTGDEGGLTRLGAAYPTVHVDAV